MRFRRALSVLAMLPALILAGCGRDKPQNPLDRPPTPETGSAAPEDHWEAAKRSAAEAGGEFQAAAQEKLDALQRQLDDLAAKAMAKGVEAKAEFERHRPEIEKKIADARADLARLKDSSGAAWEKAKAGFGAAVDDLQKSLGEAADELRGTKPPDGSAPSSAPDKQE